MSEDSQVIYKSSQVYEALSSDERSLENISKIVDNCWSAAALQEVLIFIGLHDRSLLLEVASFVDKRRHELIQLEKDDKVHVLPDVRELDAGRNSSGPVHPVVGALLAIATQSQQSK